MQQLNLKRYIQLGSTFGHKTFIEIVGTMIFHFVGSVTGSPMANGIVLMCLVYYCAKVSGAHLNPSVSLTFMLLGHINILAMLLYWCAQVSGAMLGALWILLLVPSESRVAYNGCFYPSKELSNSEIFGWETACTFTFIVPIFAVVWFTQNKSGYGNTGPIIVGLSLAASAAAAAPWTGGSLNPARTLGSVPVMHCNNVDKLVYYITGELLAGCVVPIVIIPWYGISKSAWYLPLFKTVPIYLQKKAVTCDPTDNTPVQLVVAGAEGPRQYPFSSDESSNQQQSTEVLQQQYSEEDFQMLPKSCWKRVVMTDRASIDLRCAADAVAAANQSNNGAHSSSTETKDLQ